MNEYQSQYDPLQSCNKSRSEARYNKPSYPVRGKRLLDLRTPFPNGVLIVLLLIVLASPATVLAAKKMLILAAINPTQTDQGVTVIISGSVIDPANESIPNAVISIQVNDPQSTSIHVAIRYTDIGGVFQDSFVIPQNSPGGNYTAFLAADKPGYDAARQTLNFTISNPDFSVQTSAAKLTITQGQTGSVTITILALRGYSQAVNVTAIDLPAGVTAKFNPSSLVPSGTSTVTVAASYAAPAGNHTITILAVSGSVSHKVSFQLYVNPGPFQPTLILTAVVTAIILVAVALILRSRGRRSLREEAVEQLIKEAQADTGYITTARVIARLEELRAMGKVDEATYQRLRKEYEKRLEKSK
jgi:multisubunit Na+/H+ antiporter MnhC subunit